MTGKPEFEYYLTDDKSGAAYTVDGDGNRLDEGERTAGGSVSVGVLSSQWAGYDYEPAKWGPFKYKKLTYVKWTCSCGYGVKLHKDKAGGLKRDDLIQRAVINEFTRTHRHE